MGQRSDVEIFEGQAVRHRRQLYGSDGVTLIVRDDVLFAVAYVYDLDSPAVNTPIFTEGLVIDDVYFDAPQPWRKDNVGYNFEWVAAGQYFPEGGSRYRVEIVTTVESDSSVEFSMPIPDEFTVRTRSRRGG